MDNKRIGDFTLIEKIGKGGQATVWKAVDSNQNFVAIKKMSVGGNEDNTKSYEREVAIMKLVQHEYLVKNICSFKEGSYFYLVYQYCPCDLLSLLQKQPGNKFPEQVARRWIKQLAQVMDHLNNFKIIHRDLKPENILMTENNLNADIRLADFGLARQGLTTRSFVGTLEYASPEIKNCQDYSYNTDVWSLGVILFACLFGKLPIMQGRKLVYPPNSNEISALAKEFVEACLVFDYANRPNFKDLLNHPYLNTGSERFRKIEEDKENELKVISEAESEVNENAQKVPKTKDEIENFIFDTFFSSTDVMEFATSIEKNMPFVKYFVAKHFTDKFKYILNHLLNSPNVQDFDQSFFEEFFNKSERVCNVCNQMENNYKQLTSDDYAAYSFQIEELIASLRDSTSGHILVILQEISEKMRKNIT